MTNEEKAQEIANEYGYWDDRDIDCSVKIAIEMAEWKDEYFKKLLEDKLSCFKKSHSEYMIGVCDGITSVYNILFSEK